MALIIDQHSHTPAGFRHGNRPRHMDLPDDADLCPTCEGDGELAYETPNTGSVMVGICSDCIGSGLDHTFDEVS